MRRLLMALTFSALALTACGPGSSAPATTTGPTVTETPNTPSTTGDSGTTTSSGSGPTTTIAESATTETTSGRPLAPDFTLELGGGGTYNLSDGSKPVYLVFWAEW